VTEADDTLPAAVGEAVADDASDQAAAEEAGEGEAPGSAAPTGRIRVRAAVVARQSG
jgi:hypothetical protein